MANLVRVMDQHTTALQTLHPNYRFNISYTDTSRGDAILRSMVVEAQLESIAKNNLHAIAGDFMSRMSIPTALAVGRKYKMWMCSGSSTSLELSDKREFIRFYRSIPACAMNSSLIRLDFLANFSTTAGVLQDDPQMGLAMAAFVRSMGWQNVVVLACTDAYGQSLYSSFVTGAIRFGITIQMTQTFDLGATDTHNQLSAIKQSGWRVIVYMGQSHEGKYILPQASDMGLVGKDFVWLSADGLYTVFIGSQPRGMETITKVTNGLIVVYPAERETARSVELRSKWEQVYPGVAYPPFGTQYCDCVYSLAAGLVRLAEKYGFQNVVDLDHSGTLQDFLVPFDGVSGPVQFNQETGDRLGEFTIFNAVNGIFRNPLSLTPNYTHIEHEPLSFFDGSSRVPFDRAQPGPPFMAWTDPLSWFVVLIVAFSVAVIVLVMVYLAKNRESATVRHLSFTFLMLTSLGCLCLAIAPLLSLGMPTAASCAGNMSLLLTGVNLILSCAAVKAFRIYFIYDNVQLGKSMRITNRNLLVAVGGLMSVHFLILALFQTVSPLQVGEVMGLDPYWRCKPNSSASPTLAISLSVAIFIFLGVLSLSVLYLAFRTRKVSQEWGESVWNFYAMQNVVLATGILLPFNVFDFGTRLVASWLQFIVTMYGAMFTFYALVGRVAFLIAVQHRHAQDVSMDVGAISSSVVAVEAPTSPPTESGIAVVRSSPRLSQTMLVVGDTKVGDGHISGEFPVKREDRYFSTWRRHSLHVCFRQDSPPGGGPNDTVLRLKKGILETNIAGLPNCARLNPFNRPERWLIQFSSADEMRVWEDQLKTLESVAASQRDMKSAEDALTATKELVKNAALVVSRTNRSTSTGGHSRG
ncbi:periplasmic binding protein-like I [Catenaria anguillulae PL171]|uniref:Periplasmic binding protein-like I n=1 Tax=Catenaria anguillulae PL171 TaxID=765915 RepID=A0A1Y2HQ05_9FUNG|nr:periplasmic binding protein-like I [Catenaria anguillulae PL171]